MNRYFLTAQIAILSVIVPISAIAHTASVGFLVSPSAVTTCVGGTETPCYDVEVFYGTYHDAPWILPGNQNILAEGDLALWRQDSPGETQVVGPSVAGSQSTTFSEVHSLQGVIPNTTPTIEYDYSVIPSTDYDNLASVFNVGTNYFYNNGTGLSATPVVPGFVGDVHSHQSTVVVGLAPGSYRIDYDAATAGALTPTWQPLSGVANAIFTLDADGGVVVPGAPPGVALTTTATDPSSPFTTTVTFTEPVTGLTLSDFVVGNGTASSLVMVSPGVYTILVTPTDPTAAVTVDLPANTVVDGDGDDNIASNQLLLSADPSVALSTPSTSYSGPFTVTTTFSEPVTGLTLSDYAVGNGTVSDLVMESAGVYTVLVTPTDPTAPVTVDLPASTVVDVDGNDNTASNQLSLTAAPPAVTPLTPEILAEITQVIIDEAVKDLSNQLAANQRFNRGARARFLAVRRCRELEDERDRAGGSGLELIPECDDDLISRNNVPFDVNGSLVGSSQGLDLVGNFFGQSGNYEGTRRRLVYGEFDLTNYEGGSVVGTLSGRVAWEKMTSDSTMLGYFVGAEISRSDIQSTFSGSRNTLGLSLGAYYVEDIGEYLVGDAFISLGVGANNLEIGDGVTDVDSDYVTASILMGAAISGDIEYENFTLSPEFGATYGLTRIGDVGVSASNIAVSGTDTIAAGNVTVGVLNFTPRIEIPLEINHDVYDEKQFTISPTVLCRVVRTDTSTTSCGAGLELELTAKTYDNSNRVGGRLGYQSVGGLGQSNVSLFYERSF